MEECIICFEDCTDFVSFPCDHKVCVLCYPKLKRCPLCNIEVIVNDTHASQDRESQLFDYYIIVRLVCYLIIVIIFLLFIPKLY